MRHNLILGCETTDLILFQTIKPGRFLLILPCQTTSNGETLKFFYCPQEKVVRTAGSVSFYSWQWKDPRQKNLPLPWFFIQRIYVKDKPKG